PLQASLKLRMPGWAVNRPAPGDLYRYLDPLEKRPAVTVNGRAIAAAADASGYVTIDRRWADGDVVQVDLPVEPRKIAADDRVADDRRRMAIERGPIVYCAEWPDAAGGHALDLLVRRDAPLAAVAGPPALGGPIALETEASRVTRPQDPPARVRLVPYALWANRGAGEMSVW